MIYYDKRRDIITTTADKGCAVVIMDIQNYIKVVNRQLSDKNNNKTPQTSPILQNKKMVNDTLDDLKRKFAV